MQVKEKTWKHATLIIAAVLALNPELIGLALFIDAVGLEVFILLIEIQITAILGLFVSSLIKPAYNLLGPVSFSLATSAPAMLMYLLIVLYLIGKLTSSH